MCVSVSCVVRFTNLLPLLCGVTFLTNANWIERTQRAFLRDEMFASPFWESDLFHQSKDESTGNQWGKCISPIPSYPSFDISLKSNAQRVVLSHRNIQGFSLSLLDPAPIWRPLLTRWCPPHISKCLPVSSHSLPRPCRRNVVLNLKVTAEGSLNPSN